MRSACVNSGRMGVIPECRMISCGIAGMQGSVSQQHNVFSMKGIRGQAFLVSSMHYSFLVARLHGRKILHDKIDTCHRRRPVAGSIGDLFKSQFWEGRGSETCSSIAQPKFLVLRPMPPTAVASAVSFPLLTECSDMPGRRRGNEIDDTISFDMTDASSIVSAMTSATLDPPPPPRCTLCEYQWLKCHNASVTSSSPRFENRYWRTFT